jgi:MFS family permease
MRLAHGIRPNLAQFLQLLLQVLLVGLTIGMTRTVVPALAESDFGVPKNSFVLLSSFVVAFGLVKGVMNFVAGRLSERLGRQRVLLWGWLVALPIPVMIAYAPSWGWVVAATVLLGVNQGLTWSMTQTAQLDITRLEERGLTLGLNEFAGYVGVALAGVVTAYLATRWGPRQGLLGFGLAVIGLALLLARFGVKETLPWARAEGARHAPGVAQTVRPRYATLLSQQPNTKEVFWLVSMALLYPNLSAAVADISHPAWRGSAIGIYRFWRDLGYGIGALGLGLVAHFTGQMAAAFWFVALCMLLSAGVLLRWGAETHPRLNPAPA